jgi:methyl-accepting chemotaxis protein
MSFFNRLSLSKKLSAMAGLVLLVSALPTGLYLRAATADIRFAQHEASGLPAVVALQKVLQTTQKHRGLSAGALNNNEVLAAKRPEVRLAVDKSAAELDAALVSSGASPEMQTMWKANKDVWVALQADVEKRSIQSAESTSRHTKLVAQLLLLNDEILDYFGMSRDPDAGGSRLIRASAVHAPALSEQLGRMRAMGTGFLADTFMPPEGRSTLIGLHTQAKVSAAAVMNDLDRASQLNAELKSAVQAPAQVLKEKIATSLAMAETSLINAHEFKLPATVYFDELTGTINAVFEFNAIALTQLASALDTRVQALRKTIAVVVAILLLSLVAAVVLSVVVVRNVVTQLGADPLVAGEAVNAIALGDLSAHIAVKPGDSSSLLAKIHAMQTNLVKVVTEVRHNSQSVANASAEIANGNLDLSQRTEHQASALQETAASMEQLGSTVRQNAENARQANQLALGASTVAIKGGEVVSQVVTTMKGINDSSKKIADIISVIDGIAFQTNILALNAAVEAARAGEQGRGFAVVASEVRSLAQRSAEAAKEIKGLIGASVERVEQGTTLVDQAGVTMTEIVTAIKRVTDIMGEISAASTEQSAGVAQVGEAISQMDKATQQNAALVEESAAAAEGLQAQAQQMVQAVAVFKLNAAGAETQSQTKPAPRRTEATEKTLDRRGPNRAQNVTRPDFAAKSPQLTAAGTPSATASIVSQSAHKTGSDDWEAF